MSDPFADFERIVREAHKFDQGEEDDVGPEHPFDARNIHLALPSVVRSLFDSGHYAQATFEAFKFLEKEVKRHGGLKLIGKDLMMRAFSEANPPIALTTLRTETERVEQEGYRFIFAGGVLAIRNPRGHEQVVDDVDSCLDHITFVSMLLRRLAAAGYHVKSLDRLVS